MPREAFGDMKIANETLNTFPQSLTDSINIAIKSEQVSVEQIILNLVCRIFGYKVPSSDSLCMPSQLMHVTLRISFGEILFSLFDMVQSGQYTRLEFFDDVNA